MVCAKCSSSINVITRRRCTVCLRFFCTKCLDKSFTFRVTCSKCMLLKSGRFTHQQLKDYTIKELKSFLWTQKMPIGNCIEKEDLVNLVFKSSSQFKNSRDVELLEHQRKVESMKVSLDQKLDQSNNAPTINHSVSNPLAENSNMNHANSANADSNIVPGYLPRNTNKQINTRDSRGENNTATNLNQIHSQTISKPLLSHKNASDPTISSMLEFIPNQNNLPSSRSLGNFSTPLPPSYQDLFRNPKASSFQPQKPRPSKIIQNSSDITQNSVYIPQDSTPQTTANVQVSIEPNIGVNIGDACGGGSNTSAQKFSKNVKHIKRIEEIEDEKQLSYLSTRQLKIILTNNFVTYKGCCEKKDLYNLVLNLFKERLKNLEAQKNDFIHQRATDMCKICMERTIDCVLLECGHMLSCTICSKRLHDCPICRSLVSRVVHIFKA